MKKFHLLKENKNISIRDDGSTTLRVNNNSPTYLSPLLTSLYEVQKPQKKTNFRMLTEDWKNRAKQLMRI